MNFSLFLGLVSFKALIEESEMKKFPDNDLLRHLRLVTQDAEKCASVAQQLLNGKRQTRWALCTADLGVASRGACCGWRPCPHATASGLCLSRYRSGGGKSPSQLTVSELRQFVAQLHALPCVLSQTPLLKVPKGAAPPVWGHPVFCK